jgi:CO/xanthine dehydrogenase FAD-binding subunit
MKPAPFRYARSSSVDEALALLAEEGEEAKVLAGGQSLVPLLNMRMARPSTLVDVNRIEELDRVAQEDGVLRVGAIVRQNALELLRVPLLAECLPHVGHFVTRNRGTLGGSIAHADASAELPLALAALGGSVVVASRRGVRTLAGDEFFVTHFTTALAPDELLVETRWPTAAPGTGAAFEEFALRHGDYALAMAACALAVEDGRVVTARVAVGAVADRPVVLEEAGALLVGEAVSGELAREVAQAASRAVDPPDGLHASGDYRRRLVRVLVERAVARAWRAAA